MLLTPEQRLKAKRLRATGLDFWEIAAELDGGVAEDDVMLSLANIRTQRRDPPRVSLNVSVAAAEWFKEFQLPKEAMWRTVNRLLGISS